MTGIDFATFNSVAPFVVADKKPILIRGRHGVGKSEVVYQIAEKLDLPVVERRASQMTEGDLMGLPSIDGESTSWNPPDWFKTACDHPVLLFLDEIDRATIEVRQGIFELTDSRKLNGHHLHKDTVIFGAINGGQHGAQYQVGEFDPAELDRWTVFDVEPSVEDWLSWAKGNVDEIVWDFINNNHLHLEHKGEFEPNKVYPSRRSWKRLSDCLVRGNLLSDCESSNKEESKVFPVIYNLAKAYVGMEAGIAFNAFVKEYERVVTVEDILVKGLVEKTSSFGINEHSAIVEKLEHDRVFANLLPSEQVSNIAKYFVTLPSEVGMKLWTTIGKAKAEDSEEDKQNRRQNTVNLHMAKLKNTSVKDYLVEILSGAN